MDGLFDGRSAGDRTLDPLIKSQLLYQLSYGPPYIMHNKLGAKVHRNLFPPKFFDEKFSLTIILLATNK